MKNPIATIQMANGAKIVAELLPEFAPNTVNSFISAAKKGVFDGHAIERIVPDSWVDMSYNGFRKEEGQYLIPYESKLHPEINPLPTTFGCICMGGYGELGQAGCEFFLPLRDCPEHKGVYPVFGKILEGKEEILRLRDVKTFPVTDFPYEGVIVNTPVEPQVIEKVTVETFGVDYPEPIKVDHNDIPLTWKKFREENK